jgi:type IV secretory pathway TrbD component
MSYLSKYSNGLLASVHTMPVSWWIVVLFGFALVEFSHLHSARYSEIGPASVAQKVS